MSPRSDSPAVQREAVRLTPFEEGDTPRLVSWVESPEALFAWAGSSFEWPLDTRQVNDHLAQSADLEFPRRVFKAVSRLTGEPVGHVELCQLDRHNLSATACRMLVAPDKRGSGIGTAVMHAACDIAFRAFRVHRLDLRVFTWNEDAISLYRRLGFVEEGVLRDVVRHAGRYESFLVMSMLDPEWVAR